MVSDSWEIKVPIKTESLPALTPCGRPPRGFRGVRLERKLGNPANRGLAWQTEVRSPSAGGSHPYVLLILLVVILTITDNILPG